jgi:hypothetical protein
MSDASPRDNDSDEDDNEFLRLLINERVGDSIIPRRDENLPKYEYVKSECDTLDTDVDINKKLDLEKYLMYEFEKSSLEYIELPLMNPLSFSSVERDLEDYVFKLDEKIRNILEVRANLVAQAEVILIEKLNLQRELDALNERIRSGDKKHQKNKELEHALRKRGQGVFRAHLSRLRSSYNSRFGLPYFKTADRFSAYLNEDMKEILNNNEVTLFRLPRCKFFTPLDAQKITAGILSQLKRKRVQQLRTELNKIRGGNVHSCEQQKRNLVGAINLAVSVKDVREAEEWNIPLDFLELNCKLKDSQLTSDDYERIWRLIGASNLSKEEFSSDELKKLKQLTRQYGNQDWDGIASSLGTRRSGFMCFVQWARSFKNNFCRVWTPKEDSLLRKLCTKLDRIKDPGVLKCHWDYIRRQFPQRSYTQIHSHWKYVLRPSLKKGRFTKEETGKLQRLRGEGKSFGEIASIFQSRSCSQLRAHCDQLASRTSFNYGIWSKEEEDILRELADKYGTRSWKKISEKLGTRSRSQCRIKLISLLNQKWSEEELKKFDELTKAHGTNFKKISAELGTKSDAECHYRYVKYVRNFHSSKTDKYDRTKNESKLFKTPSDNRTGSGRLKWLRPQGMLSVGSRWTTQEIDKLRDVVKLCDLEAEKVTALFETKSLLQCSMVYEKMWLNKSTRKGRSGRRGTSSSNWSAAERKSFRQLVQKHGSRIEKICATLQTKTLRQCSYMYMKMLRDQHSAKGRDKVDCVNLS